MGLNNNRYPLLQTSAPGSHEIDETRLRGVAATTEEGNENVQLATDMRYILVSITSAAASADNTNKQQALRSGGNFISVA